MRYAILFLLALGFGSLTVIGQESDDKNRELKRKIEELTRDLQRQAAARAQATEERTTVLRMYDISDLVAPVWDYAMRPSNLIPSKYQLPKQSESTEPRSPYMVDWLIELIRMTSEPESWDIVEGADIQSKNQVLIVTTLPRVQGKIAKLLEELRDFIAPHIAIDVVAVRVGPEQARLIQASPRDLDGATLAALREGERLGTLSVVCIDGQQVVQRDGALRAYLQDYEVEIAQKAQIGDPIRQEVFDGCSMEMRGILDRDRGGALLSYRIERTALDDTIRRLATEHGPLELPSMEVSRICATCWVPLGQTVVLGGGAGHHESCIFLATARRVEVGK